MKGERSVMVLKRSQWDHTAVNICLISHVWFFSRASGGIGIDFWCREVLCSAGNNKTTIDLGICADWVAPF